MTVRKIARGILKPRRREKDPLLKDTKPGSRNEKDVHMERCEPPAYADIYPATNPSTPPTLTPCHSPATRRSPTPDNTENPFSMPQHHFDNSDDHLEGNNPSSTFLSAHSTPSPTSTAKPPSSARSFITSFLSWMVVSPTDHDGNPSSYSCGVTGDCMVSGE